MTRFKVTLDLSKDEFIELFNSSGPLSGLSVSSYDDAAAAVDHVTEHLSEVKPLKPRDLASAPPHQRKLRGSKVNNAILGKLREGRAHSADLRTALADAGLAPGSLSTGLALLQKAGQIKRLGDGVYELAEAA